MIKDDDHRSSELAAFARDLARAAGEAILPHFRSVAQVDNKAATGFDPVTEADRAAEAIMRDMIAARYPDDGILGEEFGPAPSRSGRTWVLDPIDGTRSFICGLPTWTTLIGLMDGDAAVLGVASQPFIGELFIGGPFGSWCENRFGSTRLAVRPTTSGLRQAILTTVAPEIYVTPFQRRVLATMQDSTRMLRFGGDAYFFAMLAAGNIDVAMDAGLAPYDIAALVPIIRHAGGVVTTWDGGPAAHGGDILAAASPELHAEALAVINSAR